MKTRSLAAFGALFLVINALATSSVSRLQDYNAQLPFWGVSWKPGEGDINGYYPSFYTGFAMRSEFPDRIHVRTARGNQTRVSVILDQQTISDYTYDLAKRHSFYTQMTAAGGALNINPAGSAVLPQLSYFSQIIQSAEYGILNFAQTAHAPEETYAKGLQLITALNPGRVFMINLDLSREFNKWKAQMIESSGGERSRILNNPQEVVKAINSLVLGRVNYVQAPSADVMAKLEIALARALENAPAADFIAAARDLFVSATGNKYQIQVLNAGHFQPALQCSAASCFLKYPEFTAIYPTGSVMAQTSDGRGNSIPSFATPGLWQFLSRNYHEVDHIRSEPYYGWIPKMDFQDIGNGFHNPAVRFTGGAVDDVKEVLGINAAHNTLWAVKRGGVSHGCLRMPVGHVWEMRHIFPVENSKMTQVMFFGNSPRDFDLYDIDGNGSLEVMGVEYFISYSLAGTDDVGRREGEDLTINSDQKLNFYKELYGANGVFTMAGNRFTFQNPQISMQSHLDYQKTQVSVRVPMQGDYLLYEQTYERDKVQHYAIRAGGGMNNANKDLVRLMGRVRGCAPSSDKQQCGEAAFDAEKARLRQ